MKLVISDPDNLGTIEWVLPDAMDHSFLMLQGEARHQALEWAKEQFEKFFAAFIASKQNEDLALRFEKGVQKLLKDMETEPLRLFTVIENGRP